MGSKGGGKGGGRRKRGKGAGNRSTPKRSPQGNDAGADTSPGSTASPSGKSPATNRRKVDNADPSTMEVEALDDGTEAAAAKAAEEAAQRLEAEAESQNVTPDETEKIAKAKEPTPPTDQEEQDGQDRADGDEESPRSPPQRQKAYAKVAAFSDSDSDDDEVLDLTDILKPSERQEQAKKTAKKHREREAKIAEAKKLAEEKERKKTASMKAAKVKESATRDLAKQLDAAVDPPDTPKKQTSTKAKTKSKTKPRKPKFAYGSFAQTYVKLSFSARDIAKKDKPEFIVTRCTRVAEIGFRSEPSFALVDRSNCSFVTSAEELDRELFSEFTKIFKLKKGTKVTGGKNQRFECIMLVVLQPTVDLEEFIEALNLDIIQEDVYVQVMEIASDSTETPMLLSNVIVMGLDQKALTENLLKALDMADNLESDCESFKGLYRGDIATTIRSPALPWGRGPDWDKLTDAEKTGRKTIHIEMKSSMVEEICSLLRKAENNNILSLFFGIHVKLHRVLPEKPSEQQVLVMQSAIHAQTRFAASMVIVAIPNLHRADKAVYVYAREEDGRPESNNMTVFEYLQSKKVESKDEGSPPVQLLQGIFFSQGEYHMLAPSSYEKVARIWAQTALEREKEEKKGGM